MGPQIRVVLRFQRRYSVESRQELLEAVLVLSVGGVFGARDVLWRMICGVRELEKLLVDIN